MITAQAIKDMSATDRAKEKARLSGIITAIKGDAANGIQGSLPMVLNMYETSKGTPMEDGMKTQVELLQTQLHEAESALNEFVTRAGNIIEDTIARESAGRLVITADGITLKVGDVVGIKAFHEKTDTDPAYYDVVPFDMTRKNTELNTDCPLSLYYQGINDTLASKTAREAKDAAKKAVKAAEKALKDAKTDEEKNKANAALETARAALEALKKTETTTEPTENKEPETGNAPAPTDESKTKGKAKGK